jgi:polygalacturonase
MKFKFLPFVCFFILIANILFAQTEILTDPWVEASTIIEKIVVPTFPDQSYDITCFGAIGDGITDCTEAFKSAIVECSKDGGGKVIVPGGNFLTGPIYLLSNVNLNVTENAVIKFSTDPNKYLPVVFTRWEGVECMNYSPLIYAYGEENIAITGSGILDGQGNNDNWWNWKGNKDDGWKEGKPNQKKGRSLLFEMGENNTPPEKRVFGDGYYLRPSFLQPYKCKNVLIDGVTFKDSPMWFLNPVLSENITVKNVTVEGLGPNNDGFDPECSKNILVKNCYFNTGDDCIAIKSGRNNDGRRINIPSENIVIQNCVMKEGHGGVVIGSEISGGVKNVFAENCIMDSPNLERAIRLKTNSIRGGIIENLFVRNIKVGQVSEAVLKIDYYYEEGDKGAFTPEVRNVRLENVESQKSAYAIWIKAYDRSPVRNLVLKNCRFADVTYQNVLENVDEPKFFGVMFSGEGFKKDNK